jgi:hypothetical protein
MVRGEKGFVFSPKVIFRDRLVTMTRNFPLVGRARGGKLILLVICENGI